MENRLRAPLTSRRGLPSLAFCSLRGRFAALLRRGLPSLAFRSLRGRFAALLLLASLTLADGAQAAEGLTLAPDPYILIILIVTFLVLIAPVNLLLFRPVFQVLEARRERIEGAVERAERLSQDADAAMARYQRAVGEVRAATERERRQRLDAARRDQASTAAGARAEAEARIEGARGEVQSALEGARSALRTQAEELAREVAQRVLGRSLS